MPINIQLNGQSDSLPDAMSITAAIQHWQLKPGTFAIALNATFIPRAQYDDTMISNNDHVEVVSAMQGG